MKVAQVVGWIAAASATAFVAVVSLWAVPHLAGIAIGLIAKGLGQ